MRHKPWKQHNQQQRHSYYNAHQFGQHLRPSYSNNQHNRLHQQFHNPKQQHTPASERTSSNNLRRNRYHEDVQQQHPHYVETKKSMTTTSTTTPATIRTEISRDSSSVRYPFNSNVSSISSSISEASISANKTVMMSSAPSTNPPAILSPAVDDDGVHLQHQHKHHHSHHHQQEQQTHPHPPMSTTLPELSL